MSKLTAYGNGNGDTNAAAFAVVVNLDIGHSLLDIGYSPFIPHPH